MNNETVLQLDFFGDLSLNGLLCDPQYIAELRASLDELSAHLESPSLRFVNWESPISTAYDFHKTKGTILATTLDSAKAVTENFDIDIAILGNNHVADCRSEGAETTISFLNAEKIFHVGVTTSKSDTSKPLIVSKSGVLIGILSYVDNETNPNIENDANVFINCLEKDNIIKDIQELRSQVDIIVVSLHWGDEFISYPSINQRNLARSLIDSGANIIYGHHTHCLQGMEEWNKGLIFYSLGNFIFSGLKGKESYGWPRVSSFSGYYQVIISKDFTMNVNFIPLSSNLSTIALNNTEYARKKQIKISQHLMTNLYVYKSRRQFNIFYTWFFVLPYFFYKTKGGFLGVAKSIKKQHFKLLFNSLFANKY